MDCLKGMSLLKDNSVDVVITSPPYNKAGYEGKIRKSHPSDLWATRNIDYGVFNDFMKEDDYERWQIALLNEFHRVLKPDGSVFYNHKVRMANHRGSHPIEWISKSNLVFRQQIIWNRKSTPAVSPIRFLPTTELIFWCTKCNKQPNFKRRKDSLFTKEVWDLSPSRKDHPAPFPIEIPYNILLNIPSKNLLVVDPFMGSGTTGDAAIKTGNNFIGFEINEKYIK